jgi:hypothetical protein
MRPHPDIPSVLIENTIEEWTRSNNYLGKISKCRIRSGLNCTGNTISAIKFSPNGTVNMYNPDETITTDHICILDATGSVRFSVCISSHITGKIDFIDHQKRKKMYHDSSTES